MQTNKTKGSCGRKVSTMLTQYGWLIWVIFGGLFLFFMVRGGGCCAGHGSRGGRGSNDQEESDDKTEAAKSQNRARTGCH